MKARLLACLVLVWAMPAVGQPEGRYEQAVAARLAGNPGQAIALLEPILAADPGHVDARLQLGLALLALDRLDEAELAFRTVLETAPDYADARIGLARIAQRRGDSEGALAELEQVSSDSPDVAVLRRQLVPPRWALDIDGSYSTLHAPAPDWQEGAVQLRHHASRATAITGRVQLASRFNRTDVYGETRIDQQLSDGSSIYFAVGGTPGADFLPEVQLSLGGAVRVRDGGDATVLTLDARHAEYVTGDVQTVSPGIEQYLAQGRLWLTGRWINTFDEFEDHRSGYLVRVDGLATDRLRLFAGYSNAPDTSQGVVINTEAFFGGASLDLDDRTTVRASIAHEQPEAGSDRTHFALGLGVRF